MKIMIGAPRGTRRDTKSYIHTAESLRSRGFPIVIDEAQGGREGRSGGGGEGKGYSALSSRIVRESGSKIISAIISNDNAPRTLADDKFETMTM